MSQSRSSRSVSKRSVIRKLTAQGASYSESYTSSGVYLFEAWLPEELIWDTGYGYGIVTQEKDPEESMSDFWQGVLAVIDGPVIPKDQS
jgi:hypothetical protein